MKYEKMSLDRPEAENPNYMGEDEKLANERSMKVLDMRPEREDPKKTPLMFLPGWVMTPKTVEKPLQYLVDRGRRVICASSPRSKIIERASREDAAKEHLQQAFAAIIAAEQKGLQKKIIAGHSQGGICAILAAEIIAEKLSPEEIEKVVLIDPAGMIGEDNVWELISRFQSESRQVALGIFKKPKTIPRVGKILVEYAKHLAANIGMAKREVEAISRADIMEKIEKLRKMGVEVIIIHGKEDRVFPAEKVRRQAEKAGAEFIEIEGGHGKFIYEPEEMREIEEVLDK